MNHDDAHFIAQFILARAFHIISSFSRFSILNLKLEAMATENIPSTQIGVLSTKTSQTLQTFPVPSPGPGEVLIQNVAVASNPKDWKVPLLIENYSAIEGNDVAGYIAKVGEGVTEYKGGERVAAFSRTRTLDSKYGAYAQYTVAAAATTFPIPQSNSFEEAATLPLAYGAYAQYTVAAAATTFPIPQSTSFEEAATLPLAVATAFIGLHKGLGIPEKSSGEQKGIIINGAMTSVGSYAVQLAKRAGLFVIGTAGSSKDYAKALGTDVIVDYREYKGEALESALIEAAKGKNVQYVYDVVSEDGSIVLLSRVLSKVSPNGKGKVTYVLTLTEDEQKQIPQGIETGRAGAGTAYGEDQEFAARFYRQIGQWLAASPPFKPNRAKVLPEGLASVPKGLELLRTGQVHGEKLVYRIADTPGLK
ncbi:GroES-like protein [Sanghuangporus baumii]|uniref:GroES-like protein n=1 Tax=Sanghuangporus baumii TaxID=108892 RepID=A0A9Q5I2K8_SANBA|nr:GroES-like protein [Sanghuangporus baumii]